MEFTARLYFADSNYSSEDITVYGKDFNEAFHEVADMIKNKTVLVVDEETGGWLGGVVCTRSINMEFVVKFEIFKS